MKLGELGICPAPARLQQMLAEELEPSELAVLERHVERCSRCQGLLEQLTTAVVEPMLASKQLSLRKGGSAADSHTLKYDFLRALAEQPASSLPLKETDIADGQKDSAVRPPRSFPGYEVLGVLGHGGMSIVYRARQPSLNRLVALKVLSNVHADARQLARFRAEAASIAALHHPNIVQIYEVGTHEGQPYFTLELVEGGTLAGVVARGEWREASKEWYRDAAALVQTLARAMHYAHQQGIVHRDLKPANVLLTGEGRGVRGQQSQTSLLGPTRHSPLAIIPKIADFGLAKDLQASAEQTQSGAVLGTPCYMAPEQAQGQATNLGPPADIYALGAILYEMLTGRPPFTGATPLETLRRVVHDEPPAVSLLAPAVPRDLQTICLTCLQKEPGRRYATALALAEDLRRFLENQPIAARPPSALDRWGKFTRRNKALVGGLLGVMAAVLLGSVISTMFALGERQARKLADASARHALRETYRARLSAAVLALGARDFAEAENHLNAAPEELRGWEWQHFRSRLIDESPVMVRLPEEYEEIEALLPASPCLVARRRDDQGIDLLLARTGAVVRSVPAGNFFGVGQTSTGPVAFVQLPGGPLSLLDEKGNLHPTGVPSDALGQKADTALAINADGSMLAIARNLGNAPARLEVRDVASGELRRVIPQTTSISHLAIDLENPLVAAACGDSTIRMWNLITGIEDGVFRGQRGAIRGLLFRPGGGRLLSWGDDAAVRQWRLPGFDIVTGMHAHNRTVYAASYSSDGKRIASGGEDRTVRLWRTANGEALTVLSRHSDAVRGVEFLPDGTGLVSIAADRTVRTWPLLEGADPRVLTGQSSPVTPVVYSPDGRWFATGGWGPVVRVWDANSGKKLRDLQGGTFVASLAVGPDGTRLFSRAGNGRVSIWDPASGELLANFEAAAPEGSPTPDLAFRPDGAIVVIGAGNRLRLLDSATGQAREEFSMDVPGQIRLVGFSPEGRQCACATQPSGLYLKDGLTGQTRQLLGSPAGRVSALAFSHDGRWLAAADEHRIVRIWETATATLAQELQGHTGPVLAAAFHPDGTRLATAGRDRVIRFWDPTNGDEVARLQGHQDDIGALAFSPDGRTLMSGSTDNTVLLWDTFSLARRLEAKGK